MKIRVIKSNGEKEKYNPKKVIRVAKAAGLSMKDARLLEHKVSKWLEKRNKAEIESKLIRRKVIENLKKMDKMSANFYIWYKKREAKDHRRK